MRPLKQGVNGVSGVVDRRATKTKDSANTMSFSEVVLQHHIEKPSGVG